MQAADEVQGASFPHHRGTELAQHAERLFSPAHRGTVPARGEVQLPERVQHPAADEAIAALISCVQRRTEVSFGLRELALSQPGIPPASQRVRLAGEVVYLSCGP